MSKSWRVSQQVTLVAEIEADSEEFAIAKFDEMRTQDLDIEDASPVKAEEL